MTTHHIKCELPHFVDVLAGRKRFEIRRNDRDYKVGDRLVLSGYDRDRGCHLGQYVEVSVTHLLTGPLYGLAEGYVCMSIRYALPDAVEAYDRALLERDVAEVERYVYELDREHHLASLRHPDDIAAGHREAALWERLKTCQSWLARARAVLEGGT